VIFFQVVGEKGGVYPCADTRCYCYAYCSPFQEEYEDHIQKNVYNDGDDGRYCRRFVVFEGIERRGKKDYKRYRYKSSRICQ